MIAIADILLNYNKNQGVAMCFNYFSLILKDGFGGKPNMPTL